MNIEYRRLGRAEMTAMAPRAQDVFRLALGYGPMEGRVLAFADNLRVHAGRAGMEAVAALEGDQLVGFTYGYRGTPGQWWHDQVAAALAGQGLTGWMRGSFELAELHVLPARQGRGVGGRLHDLLLEAVDAPAAVLSTRRGETPAMALYRSRGWEVLIDAMDFPSVTEQFRILGKRLAPPSARRLPSL